jgi:hypothetical protein
MMLEELERRNYTATTIRRYLRFVERFAEHFSPRAPFGELIWCRFGSNGSTVNHYLGPIANLGLTPVEPVHRG